MSRLCLLFALVVGLVAATTPPAAAQEDRASDGRVLFEQGRTAYEAGRFEDAARAFRRAYVLSSRHQLLYNVGQSELRAGNDARALEAFEAFLRQASADEPNRSEVEERVRVLRSMGATSPATAAEATVISTAPEHTAAPTTPVLDAPVAPPTRDEGPGAAPWIVVGIGGAAVIAGAVLMGVGVAESSRVTGAPVGSRWDELEGSAASANVLWGAGIGVAAAGLAAVGIGVVWAVAAAPSERESGASARVRVGPLGLGVEGEF